MTHAALRQHIRDLITSAGAVLNVSLEAEKLAVMFPEFPKAEICVQIIETASAAGIGLELENLGDSGGRWPLAVMEDKIRRRAYEIWEEEGRPADREQDHWLRAKEDLFGMSVGTSADRPSGAGVDLGRPTRS